MSPDAANPMAPRQNSYGNKALAVKIRDSTATDGQKYEEAACSMRVQTKVQHVRTFRSPEEPTLVIKVLHLVNRAVDGQR